MGSTYQLWFDNLVYKLGKKEKIAIYVCVTDAKVDSDQKAWGNWKSLFKTNIHIY